VFIPYKYTTASKNFINFAPGASGLHWTDNMFNAADHENDFIQAKATVGAYIAREMGAPVQLQNETYLSFQMWGSGNTFVQTLDVNEDALKSLIGGTSAAGTYSIGDVYCVPVNYVSCSIGRKARMLDGVPVTVKDNRTTSCMPVRGGDTEAC